MADRFEMIPLVDGSFAIRNNENGRQAWRMSRKLAALRARFLNSTDKSTFVFIDAPEAGWLRELA